LDDVAYLQPFSTVHYTPPDLPLDSPLALTGPITRPSFGNLVNQGRAMEELIAAIGQRRPGSPAPGHAVAVRRELLETVGLYDAAIIGGGDLLLMAALGGTYEPAMRRHVLSDARAEHYLAWAGRWNRAVGGRLGCIPGDLIHLWHGDMPDRRSPQRYHDLGGFDFNPVEDIEVDTSGCWRWSSDKPALHAMLREYFISRKEDGPLPAAWPAIANVELAAA
jgi:hypothetical protein